MRVSHIKSWRQICDIDFQITVYLEWFLLQNERCEVANK
jgi:hypothetical protein